MRAVYAGSFDPITYGHLSIIRRAQALFGSVVVLVAVNPNKHSTFSLEERVMLIHETLEYGNVGYAYPAYTYGYVAEWCRRGDVLVRGIRDGADLEQEQEIAAFNRNPIIKKLDGRVCYPSPLETVWLPSSDGTISSSACKELARAGSPELNYKVAPAVAKALKERCK